MSYEPKGEAGNNTPQPAQIEHISGVLKVWLESYREAISEELDLREAAPPSHLSPVSEQLNHLSEVAVLNGRQQAASAFLDRVKHLRSLLESSDTDENTL